MGDWPAGTTGPQTGTAPDLSVLDNIEDTEVDATAREMTVAELVALFSGFDPTWRVAVAVAPVDDAIGEKAEPRTIESVTVSHSGDKSWVTLTGFSDPTTVPFGAGQIQQNRER